MANNYSDKIDNILCNGIHYNAGPLYKKFNRYKAKELLPTNELQSIYHLVESHVPSLRVKTVLHYEKIASNFNTATPPAAQPAANPPPLSPPTLHKSYVALDCADKLFAERVARMTRLIAEMPDEWTVVQFTPAITDHEEDVEIDATKFYSNSFYLSVFNCGAVAADQARPFCVLVERPIDKISGEVVELAREMQTVMEMNKSSLGMTKERFFRNVKERATYRAARNSTNDRLKNLIHDLQNMWLKHWRCLLIGKYVNPRLDNLIREKIKSFFRTKLPNCLLSERNETILVYIVRGSSNLNLNELKQALEHCFPDNKKNYLQLLGLVQNIAHDLKLNEEKKHPVILIIDDNLDYFPWEMIDVLRDASVSRMPSLYMLHALFKEHEATIRNGYKIVKNYNNGTYIINPSLDLKTMENRLISFQEYWLPEWRGLAGIKPTEQQFEEMLLTGDIFNYSGHGSGVQFFSMEKIQKIHIEAVVLLFGCSSTKLQRLGPQVEMFGTYQVYLIACSPCVVGMLWEVTDIDTDSLTTDFLSKWIPSNATIEWKLLNKDRWRKGEAVNFHSTLNTLIPRNANRYHEPDLLKALSLTKNSSAISHMLTKAACVARGIPVKIGTVL